MYRDAKGLSRSEKAFCRCLNNFCSMFLLPGKNQNEPERMQKEKKRRFCCEFLYALIILSGKIMEQIVMETLLRHMESKEVVGDRQHDFTKDTSCWNSQLSMTQLQCWWMREEQLRLSTWTCANIWHWSTQHLNLYRETWIWWLDDSVDKELAGQSHSRR